MQLNLQIEDLLQTHPGLRLVGFDNVHTVLSGTLCFAATFEELPTITDSFEIVVRIPETFPEHLPEVYEVGGSIDSTYGHVFVDGRACLGAPVEMRRVFALQPSLLGFLNNLVIPYFYGFRYWKMFGKHPFGELAHNGEGIIEYYVEILELKNDEYAISVLCFLILYGFQEELECPCGSGLKVRHCHAGGLLELHQLHTPQTLRSEWHSAIQYCISKWEDGTMRLSEKLFKEIQLIHEKWNSNRTKRKFLNIPSATQFHRSEQESC